MPQSLEEVCEGVRRDQHYYQGQLQQFFTQLDRDSTLRIKVEQAIYSSTGEISIDVLYQRGEYAIAPKNDHSDARYRQYISILKEDEQLQKLLHQVTDGEDKQQEFLQRARDLVAAIRMQSNLERMVKEDLLQAFQDGTAREGLAGLHQLAAEAKVEEQKSLEVMNEPQATAAYKKAALAYKEWRKNFSTRLPHSFWTDLSTQLVHYQISRVDPTFNPELIAYGHTHPNSIDEKCQNDKEAGPSPIDLRGERHKPELIFTPYADKWLIHQVICGESILSRKYQRSTK